MQLGCGKRVEGEVEMPFEPKGSLRDPDYAAHKAFASCGACKVMTYCSSETLRALCSFRLSLMQRNAP